VGNIFPLGTWYAEKMNMYFTDKEGNKKPAWFGSYGIGPTRVMGTLVEVNNDEKGIVWPECVAPFDVHLVDLLEGKGKDVYESLKKAGVEVFWDDRNVNAGQKFADADLIGIPVRLVMSGKTKGKVEWKRRDGDKAELVSVEEVIKRMNI